MNLNEIDWRAEALAFAKKHDTRTAMVVQLVELAMRRGAAIAIEGATEMIHDVGVDLKKKIKASEPHKSLTRTINLNEL